MFGSRLLRKEYPKWFDFIFFYQFNLEKNQMNYNCSRPLFDSLPRDLDQLLSQVPPSLAERYSCLAGCNLKKEFQIYRHQEGREVLLRLIEKNKASHSRKNWKVDETNYLLFVVEKYCVVNNRNCQQLTSLDWSFISKLVPSRDPTSCQFRYLSLRPNSVSQAPWSDYERQLLLRIISNQKSLDINWKLISEQLYQISREKIFRTGKQCREHYTCFLRPNLKKGAWTDDQDYLLMNLFLKMGKKWSKMTQLIEGRNQNSIKNRFFLMFQSKSDTKFCHSDLVKIVRRRKQKMQKKLRIVEQEKLHLQSSMNTTPNNSDSSNFQQQGQQDEAQRPIRPSLHSQIFFNQHHETLFQPTPKVEDEFLFANQEFERYIDL